MNATLAERALVPAGAIRLVRNGLLSVKLGNRSWLLFSDFLVGTLSTPFGENWALVSEAGKSMLALFSEI